MKHNNSNLTSFFKLSPIVSTAHIQNLTLMVQEKKSRTAGEMARSSVTMLLALATFSLILFALGARAATFPCNELEGFTGEKYQFCNRSLSDDARVADLVLRFTVREKIDLLVNNATSVPRLGIPSYEWWNEGLHGVAYSPGVSFSGPILAATSFPQPILTAASFNVTLWNEIGRVVSTEARAFHNAGQAGLTYWTPNINLFRDPRWGRGAETSGEDPLLTSVYAEYFVRGLQEDGVYHGDATQPPPKRLKLSACCKHFTAYDLDAWEGVVRYGFDAQVTEQDLYDSFNPPFKACIQNGRASGLMCSYNAVNGVPTCADKDLLTGLARNTWGFDGYIVSDCDAVQTAYANHMYDDPAGVVADTLEAGMDVNCGDTLYYYTEAALDENLIGMDTIDMALKHSFAVQFRLGMFDGAQDYSALGAKDVCTDTHQQLALDAALQSIVLLKNEKDVLPLSPVKIQKLVVVGPDANDSINTMLGNYAGNPCNYVTPLKGLGEYVASVRYLPGCLEANCEVADIAPVIVSSSFVEADAIVLMVGLALEEEREAFDRTDLLLPGQQQSLVAAVVDNAGGRPVVLVVMSGGPVDISFARDDPRIGAILWIGYPGQAGGDALAQIIFGMANPGGKLPSTWYSNNFTEEWPMTKMDMRPDVKSGYPGRTYRFYTGEPIYHFGEGLSYSKLVHELKISAANNPSSWVALTAEELDNENLCSKLEFGVDVAISSTNWTEGPPVSDVILLYVSPPGAGTEGRPLKQLVDFKRVAVGKAGVVAHFTLDPCKQFVFTTTGVDGSLANVLLVGVYTLSVNEEAVLPVMFN